MALLLQRTILSIDGNVVTIPLALHIEVCATQPEFVGESDSSVRIRHELEIITQLLRLVRHINTRAQEAAQASVLRLLEHSS